MGDRLDAVVVGGGVIGLACARALARAGREVVVVERERSVGEHQSSRNSEVLHAGLYYPTGSAKARWCVAGRRALVDFARQRGIPHRLTGKLVVATQRDQILALRQLHERARANGVDGLEWLDAAAARAREPALRCEAALWSPQTGIIDSHQLMLALQADIDAAGGHVVAASEVRGVRGDSGGFVLDLADGPVACRQLVLAAGMDTPRLARRVDALAAAALPTAYFPKGSYFRLAGCCPFGRLIYPLPVDGGLGVHLTLDLAGGARFGPDVQWCDAPDYRVDATRADAFAQSIRQWWPGLPDDALTPDYAGVRARIAPPGEPAPDFRVDGPREHGVAGLVCLFGIESPGLTACLAIGDAVVLSLSASSS